MAELLANNLLNDIRKRRNRSADSNSDSPESKKLKDVVEIRPDDESNCEDEQNDEVMAALDSMETIGEQLSTILSRLKKLDIIESSVKNIETSLANLEARTTKLEDFEAVAKKDIEDLKNSCSFNGDQCKKSKDALKKQLDGQNERIASLQAKEKELSDKISELTSKGLYLEAYSRRENIKFFNIPEPPEGDEDTEETLRAFMETELGFRNARTAEIQRVHRLNRRKNATGPRAIIARFLRYKDVDEIFALGRRLEGSGFQMFHDLPLDIIKRRKDQMAVYKKARRDGMRASFSRSQPDKLYINGKLWSNGQSLDVAEGTDE